MVFFSSKSCYKVFYDNCVAEVSFPFRRIWKSVVLYVECLSR